MIEPSYRSYQNTTVRAEKSQAEITKELAKYGIFNVQHTQTEDSINVAFSVDLEETGQSTTVRIWAPYDRASDAEDRIGWKQHRIKYRVIFHYVKGLLSAWDSGLKPFMNIFMGDLVLPDGRTISEHLLPKYEVALQAGKMPEVSLLPGGED